MISLLLFLFFLSLAGIIVMIGRKLVLLRNGKIANAEGILFQTPYMGIVKHLTIRNVRKYSYLGLVEIIRFYVRAENFLKLKYEEIKIKIKNIKLGHKNGISADTVEKPEASKFLKMVSEYKHKISKIKHQIHEEENTK